MEADPRVTPPATDSRSHRWRWAVLCLVLFSLFFGLGNRGLNEPDEGRYAGAGYEMYATGDWLVPRLNGIEHLSKPPVTYWLIAASMHAFGVNEFAARLPAAFGALGALLAVYVMVRCAQGETAALWAVVVLLTTGLFFAVARLITTDMLLTGFITGGIACLWCWYNTGQRRAGWLVGFYLSLALAFLTKGPVGLLIPVFAVAGLRWRNPALSLRRMHWGKGLLLFTVVAFPWFIAVALREPELWHYFLVRETVERMASGVHGRSEPFWFFFAVLPVTATPWTSLLPVTWTLRDATGRTRDLARMCAGWVLLSLGLFTASRSKLVTYMLPLVPPLAVLITLAWHHATARGQFARRRGLQWGCGFAAVVMLAIVLCAGSMYVWKRFEIAGLPVEGMFGVGGVVAVAGFIVLWRGRAHVFLGTLAGCAAAILLAAVGLAPSFEQRMGSQTSAKFIAERIEQADPAGTAPVVALHVFLRGLPLYLRHPVTWYYPEWARAKEPHGASFQFTNPREGAANVVEEPDAVRALVNGEPEVFLVARTKESAGIQKELRVQLYELMRAGRFVLFSNHPPRPVAQP